MILMEITIIKETDEPLLQRKKILAEVTDFASTPSRAELKEAVAKKAKADAALLFVDKITQDYGNRKAELVCFAYKDAKMADLLTKDGLRKRIAAKKAKAAPAAQ